MHGREMGPRCFSYNVHRMKMVNSPRHVPRKQRYLGTWRLDRSYCYLRGPFATSKIPFILMICWRLAKDLRAMQRWSSIAGCVLFAFVALTSGVQRPLGDGLATNGRHGAVASESTTCSQIGINLMKAGGNAADAVSCSCCVCGFLC